MVVALVFRSVFTPHTTPHAQLCILVMLSFGCLVATPTFRHVSFLASHISQQDHTTTPTLPTTYATLVIPINSAPSALFRPSRQLPLHVLSATPTPMAQGRAPGRHASRLVGHCKAFGIRAPVPHLTPPPPPPPRHEAQESMGIQGYLGASRGPWLETNKGGHITMKKLGVPAL